MREAEAKVAEVEQRTFGRSETPPIDEGWVEMGIRLLNRVDRDLQELHSAPVTDPDVQNAIWELKAQRVIAADAFRRIPDN